MMREAWGFYEQARTAGDLAAAAEGLATAWSARATYHNVRRQLVELEGRDAKTSSEKAKAGRQG